MRIVLFLLLYFSFYAAKGVIIRKKPLNIVLPLTVAALWLGAYSVNLGFSGVVELILKIVLLCGLGTYILRLLGIRLPVPFIFSVFEINQDVFELRYLVFKPGFLLLTNIYCLIKQIPVVRFSDVIEVDVKIAEQQIVMLKL